MYRGLIDNLAFVYGFICKGRGKLGEDEQEEDRKDMALAVKMDDQIEEATVFLLSLENI